MRKMFKKYGLVAGFVLLAACDTTPSGVYVNSGDPERLIDLSSETVSLGLDSGNTLSRLTEMVESDRPTGAELRCSIDSTRCAQAKEVIERRSIPIYLSEEDSNSVTLLYDRMVIRDCEQHYVDNMRGDRSYNHPAFGCSVAGNIMQMVADKRQFTDPSLMDIPDAEKANQSYNNYLKPSSKRTVKAADSNLVGN